MKYLTLLFAFSFCSYSALAQSNCEYKKHIEEYRKQYKADFLKDQRSPFYGRKRALKKLRFFKPDAKYKVNCRFEATPNAKPFEMATYSGNVKTYIQYGILHFEIDGKKHQLSIYRSPMLMRIEAYANHLFAPFKDATNGVTTYGGGRYIDLEIGHIKDNKVVLDFNKCYNPWCAYSSGYNCPVPPRENHLSIAIEAGEKNYKGKKQ